MHHPIDRIVHTTAFVIPVMEHWLEREIGCDCFHNLLSGASSIEGLRKLSKKDLHICYCLYLFWCLYSLKIHAHCPGNTVQLYELSVLNSKLEVFVSC